MTKPLIAYIRVSSQQQHASGLGEEAQLAALRAYAKDTPILHIYREVESGRKSDRPQLALALEHCRTAHATLVVAKLDRLSRSVAFLSALMESDCEFVACDMPTATRLTLHLLAAVAEHETMMISARTKAALAAAKERGVLMGAAHPNGHCIRHTYEWACLGGKAVRDKAKRYYLKIADTIRHHRAMGLSYPRIASLLNDSGVRNQHGRPFTPYQVGHVLRNYSERTA